MKKHEKWLYQENSLSQQLMMLYILGNTAYIIIHVNKMNVDYQLGAFVMLNIIISLLSFLIAVRQKLYALKWGYVGVALAVFQLSRLIWIPEEITSPVRYWLMVLLVATGILALISSIICIRRTQERRKFIGDHQIDMVTFQR